MPQLPEPVAEDCHHRPGKSLILLARHDSYPSNSAIWLPSVLVYEPRRCCSYCVHLGIEYEEHPVLQNREVVAMPLHEQLVCNLNIVFGSTLDFCERITEGTRIGVRQGLAFVKMGQKGAGTGLQSKVPAP